MLKSTYKPSPAALQPLPPGWTEHKAPTGHTYYYNAATKESTYKRPGAAPPPDPSLSYLQHQAVPHINLSDPKVANAYMAQYAQPPPNQQQPGHRGGAAGAGAGRGGAFQPRPRPQPHDRPRSKVPIPGCEPWILVYTKYGRRFAFNPDKNASFWRIPDKLMPAIIELDKERIRQKALARSDKQTQAGGGQGANDKSGVPTAAPAPGTTTTEEQQQEPTPHDYDSSEYEEVDVTDDEDEDQAGANPDGTAPKRQRTQDPAESGPVEFTEADIAAQLAAMNADYDDEMMMMMGGGGDGGDDDDYDGQDDWGAADQQDQGLPLTDDDARELFKDLLNDHAVNPYSPFDKLLEEGKVFDDARYTVLPTTKARRDVWEAWSRAKIAALRDARARQDRVDPRIPYLALLQHKASPKLYWPEFRRKYKREPAMRDAALPDKDRERLYREHVARLKMPAAALKADLKRLLESVPPSALNRATHHTQQLPAQVLADVRYISLDPSVRDPFVEAYIQGLGPPPGDQARAQEELDGAAQRAQEERRRREGALRERERAVADEKRRVEKRVLFERARLREEEREIERAMHVDKRGLQSQLVAERDKAAADAAAAAASAGGGDILDGEEKKKKGGQVMEDDA